jgi:hypothetical protein
MRRDSSSYSFDECPSVTSLVALFSGGSTGRPLRHVLATCGQGVLLRH